MERHRDRDTLLGVVYRGELPGLSHEVTIPKGPLSEGVSLKAKGDALLVEAEDPAEVLCWIKWQKGYMCHPTPKEYPGVIQNQYGWGKTLFFAFDLGMTLTEETYEIISEIVQKGIVLIHTEGAATPIYPYRYVPVAITIKDLDGPIDLLVTENYPEGVHIYDPQQGAWVMERPWRFKLHLEEGETQSIS